VINFVIQGLEVDDRRLEYAKYAHGLGLPVIRRAERPTKWHDYPLAVIGGGPSIADHLHEIRELPDRWAINSMGRYLREHDIDFTFLTIDSEYQPLEFMRSGDKALVGTWCYPEIFEQLNDCDVRIFDVADGNVAHLTTSASAACHLGPLLGYRKVIFFGCESSYPEGKTHVHKQIPIEHWLIVRCNGQEFLTDPQMWIQADAMARVLRMFPGIYKEQSGGLLGALVADPEYELVAAADSVHQALDYANRMSNDDLHLVGSGHASAA